ncbi:TetR/AcrR family transcriptional regulator [Bacillaceae bacterium S4-13-58]
MAELRDAIMEAALELFEKHGYHGVSVNDIVKACNTSKGGFYHYFQSKDDLLFEIHDTFITYVLEKANHAFEKHERPLDQLYGIIQVFVRVFDIYKPHITVFYQESNYLKPDYEEEIKEKRDQFRLLLRTVIEEGIQRGEFRKEIPANITVMSILGMVNWTYKWYRKNGEYSIEDIANIFTDFILHSVVHSSMLGEARTKGYLLTKDT